MQITIERNLGKLVNQARECFAEFRHAERALLRDKDIMLMLAHRFGGILCELKEEIGHGKWMLWLPANFPELGSNDDRRIHNAGRCMRLFKENQIGENSANFTVESVRKFMWGYVPVKERLQFDGDEIIKPSPHHLTFVNQFSKWDQQYRNGHVEMFSVETLRREVAPMLRRLAELCGRDWISTILG
jgi:hypothetical protein